MRLIITHILSFYLTVLELIRDGNIIYLFKPLQKNGFRPELRLNSFPTTDELFQDALILQEKMERIITMNSVRIFALDLSPVCIFEKNKRNSCGDIGKCQVMGNESDLSSTLFGIDKAGEINFIDNGNCNEKKTKVDMLKNPPANTQYKGEEIWRKIYYEIEKVNFPLLKKLISGIQSNIAIHASERHRKIRGDYYDYSLSNFMNKFAIFEERGVNLLVTFYYIVRSICILGPSFEKFMENLDNSAENIKLKEEVRKIFDKNLYYSCKPKYQNNVIPPQSLPKLERFFKTFISALGCVECEKCILHGTIKCNTLDLAVKALGGSKNISLDPIYFVTYLNGLYIFSTSITTIDLFTFRVRIFWVFSLFITVIFFFCFKYKIASYLNQKKNFATKKKEQ
ncbi:endoplasmic reticulum oxidoreductin [Cryptosporidium ubiquitum]|uniref:Endoplasmic reticulum oxidoreductin n=1 Tax=Cryptosporidium ubiquitum TaxID=857276 RepID=A0A1J4MHN9_9CRYT|nr:endoplasmic reticulum oxidoreductin [Cryptosporidium ubiquitum]OII73750.1 endoplasmic reticulum oxidoreductin [Cryptosporidium ubiquitum]